MLQLQAGNSQIGIRHALQDDSRVQAGDTVERMLDWVRVDQHPNPHHGEGTLSAASNCSEPWLNSIHSINHQYGIPRVFTVSSDPTTNQAKSDIGKCPNALHSTSYTKRAYRSLPPNAVRLEPFLSANRPVGVDSALVETTL